MNDGTKLRKHKLRLLLFGLMLLLIMLVIFLMSCQSGHDSQMTSNRFSDSLLGRILSHILPPLRESFRGSIRKYAHVFEFFCLGICSFLFFHELYWIKEKRLFKAAFSAAVWSFLYACSDEWHQTFVPERAGRITDLGFDAAGFLCGIVLIGLVVWIRQKKRNGIRF